MPLSLGIAAINWLPSPPDILLTKTAAISNLLSNDLAIFIKYLQLIKFQRGVKNVNLLLYSIILVYNCW